MGETVGTDWEISAKFWQEKYQHTIELNSAMLKFIINKGLSEELTAYRVALRMDQDILEDLYEEEDE